MAEAMQQMQAPLMSMMDAKNHQTQVACLYRKYRGSSKFPDFIMLTRECVNDVSFSPVLSWAIAICALD